MEMDLTTRIIAIVVLILFSGYFSMAEISLAASPKVKLHQALDAGDKRAQKCWIFKLNQVRSSQ